MVVLGDDAKAVAEHVVALRAEGRRAAGFVGRPDDRAAAEAMAVELFGDDAGVLFLGPPSTGDPSEFGVRSPR